MRGWDLALVTALATAGCVASAERDFDAGPLDAGPLDAALADVALADACVPAAPMGCSLDDGVIDLRGIGYERAWVVGWAGFTNGVALVLGGADGIGCGARVHQGGDSFVEDETWIGPHELTLSASEEALVDPIAVTLRIDEMDGPYEDGTPGTIQGALELRPETGAAIVRTDVTLPVCQIAPSF